MKKSFLVLFILSLIFIACDESILTPPPEKYGITGRVLDKNGNIIPEVKFYCLYNYYYIPNPEPPSSPFNISEVDSFSYELFQNFNNPVYNSTFVRYSLAADNDIELTIRERNTGVIKYSFTDHQSYGLYQHHINEIVSSLQLENGCYFISLKVTKNGAVKFQDEKKMFVISELGTPNSISDGNGKYFYDYNKASIADTIFSTPDGQNIYPQIITNQINFFVKKDGYISKTFNTELYQGILLNRDIILQKEAEQ